MTEENPAAETDRPQEQAEGAEARKEPTAAAEAGARASGEAQAAGAAKAPQEPPEDPIESLRAVRAFLGEEVEEVTSFTGKPDEVSVVVPARRIGELCEHLKTQHGFTYLSDLCGVHYPERDRPVEVVYQLFSIERSERLRLKVRVADGEPVPSVSGVWRTANWLEREAYDMFGIEFEGHPDLRRILLPEDWEGHPLRKEYPVRGDGFGLRWVERQIPPVSRPVQRRK